MIKYFIMAIIVIYFIYVIYKKIKDIRKGKLCSSGCANCPMKDKCDTREENKL